MTASTDILVRVVEAEKVADGIKRLKLVAANGKMLPDFSGGAHTVVVMQDGDRQRRNPYSLMGIPGDSSSYQISVLRTTNSRGGSTFIHDKVEVGSELYISPPVNLFPIDRRARRHLLIAGGIGITPFIAMMAQLAREEAPFELHYAMRSTQHGAYWPALRALYGHRVHTYADAEQQVLPLDRLLESQPLGTHLYVCGPTGMIDWVLQAARSAGWPDENVHFERFCCAASGQSVHGAAGKIEQDDFGAGTRESARSPRRGRPRSAVSVPRRCLRTVRDGRALVQRIAGSQRPLPLRRATRRRERKS